MRAAIGAAALVLSSAAAAAPAAEVVVYWAPAGTPADLSRAAAAASTEAGAAFFDRSPRATPAVDVGPLVTRGRAAYDDLRFEDAIAALDQAEAALAGPATAVTAGDLADLFLFRALARIQLGQDAAAWEDLVTSARLQPGRFLDPARFPPRAIEALTRADQAVAAVPPASLAVDAAGCQLTVDGAAASSPAQVSVGAHWLTVACPNRPVWAARVTVPSAGLAVDVPPIASPTDDAALIQARAVGARSLLVVAVIGASTTLRRLGVDGRELDRRTTAATSDAVAGGITALLTPTAPAGRWYRSRWVWAAAGAAAATAVLVPFLALRSDERTIVVRPTGISW